jgi:hypothetical protein
MNVSETINIFQRSIADYHFANDVDTEMKNPFPKGRIEYLLYEKNWIDTVQWHLEDIIRNPEIDPIEALAIKRRIDASNQHRTDLVEYIDSWFLKKYQDIKVLPNATINTESPAWAVDRLSILELKIYHMQAEVDRKDADPGHTEKCRQKLNVLITQRVDLSTAIQQLLNDYKAGNKYMKVYKQMKMYNDESLNPVLYKSKSI